MGQNIDMTWIIMIAAILIGLLLWPFFLEWRRTPVEQLRQSRPGSLAQLSQGLTYYQWSGPEDGDVTVCVHGLSTPSFVWEGVVSELTASGYRVLTYDLYGRGGSDRARGAQSGVFYARQFHDLLDHLRVEGRVNLIGYSMGGAIATYIAAHHPDRIRNCVLIAPAGLGHDLGGFSRFVARAGWLGNWLQMVMAGRNLRHYIASEAATITPAVSDIHARMAVETRARGFAMAVLSSLRNMLSDNLADEHCLISSNGIRVQVIWGETDDLIPLSGQDWLKEINPSATQFVIKDCGHEIPYAQPKKLIELVKEFLDSSPNN